MIDIASLNSNLPTYFEALDSSNNNSNQTLLQNNGSDNNSSNNNEKIPTQSLMSESSLFPNNNNVVLQNQPKVIPSTVVQQLSMVHQQNILQTSPLTYHSNISFPHNSMYPNNTVIYNNTPNTINNSEIFQQSAQPSPSPYNNNTIVSPMNRVTIPNQPQYTVINKNISIPGTLVSYSNASPPNININAQVNPASPMNPNIPINSANTYINSTYANNSSNNVMYPPSEVIGPQGNMNHAYSAPVFSNNLSPPSLPNYEINSGLALGIAIPSNSVSTINPPPNAIQTPIISNRISSNMLPSNTNTPMNLSNNLIIPNESSTDLTSSIEMSTPLVMTTSMPILSNNLSTPHQGTTTPVLPSSLFGINSGDHVIDSTNSTLVIPSDLTCIAMDNQQVPSLDCLSPPVRVNSMSLNSSHSIPSTTPPSKSKFVHYEESSYSTKAEDVPLLNVGATPSVKSKDFINSLPTPKDTVTMKCTFNREGITLDSITEAPQHEINKSLEMKMPISPKEEISKNIASTSLTSKLNKATYPSPQILNKKGTINEKNVYIMMHPSSHKSLKQEVRRGDSVSLPNKENMININSKDTPKPENITINTIYTPKTTPYTNTIATPLANSMPTPVSTPLFTPKIPEISTPSAKSMPTPITPSINSKKVNTIVQDHYKRSTNNRMLLSKNITAPVVLSSLSSVVESIKAKSSLSVTNTGKNEKEASVKSKNKNKKGISVKEQSNDRSEKEISDTQSNDKKENEKEVKLTVPKTVPLKFSEPLALRENAAFTEPIVFVDPLSKENNKAKSNDIIILKNDKKESNEVKLSDIIVSKNEEKESNVANKKSASVIELIKEANIKNKNQSLAYTKYLLEKKFTYNKANKPKKTNDKLKNQNSDQSKNDSKASDISNHVVEVPSPALSSFKPKNYTEPLPFIDTGDLTLEDLLNEATIQNKNLTYNDILTEDNMLLKPITNQFKEIVKSKENKEKESDFSTTDKNRKDIKNEKEDQANVQNTPFKEETIGVKRKEEGEIKNEDTVLKKRKIEEKKVANETKKRSFEENATSSEGKKKKRTKKETSENKKKRNKDISEDGVMSKVKYNSNNISIYVSELKVLTKFQTKDDQDIYPLRCVCEGDLEDKELGLEDLVCTYPNCNKAFGKSIHLEKHFIEHGDDFRPYQCPNCTKTFRRRYDLMRHGRIHNYIIPYRCSRCLRGFTRSDSCARHAKTRQCKYFDFDKLNEKKENPPYYVIVKDPSNKTEKDIIIIPLNKEKIKE
ncbi:hypothetical protein BCR36DRAFT_580347 [Piromyces finnis]|uniref:C2H2-type domain-containing protein n=1 Tax=Piromyces finnis TaxID=1754191 RepID=A0A1Y1VJ89_9FUNG|nr:hypothetical protein BCR36DRAFT_580347 [Piromyces finnis]|eukprot:ORX57779.1 hypothetical protein BCR36DRAFT_580347 [Piromyces finnis]